MSLPELMGQIPEMQKRAEENEARIKNIEILVTDNHKLLNYLTNQIIKLRDEK